MSTETTYTLYDGSEQISHAQALAILWEESHQGNRVSVGMYPTATREADREQPTPAAPDVGCQVVACNGESGCPASDHAVDCYATEQTRAHALSPDCWCKPDREDYRCLCERPGGALLYTSSCPAHGDVEPTPAAVGDEPEVGAPRVCTACGSDEGANDCDLSIDHDGAAWEVQDPPAAPWRSTPTPAPEQPEGAVEDLADIIDTVAVDHRAWSTAHNEGQPFTDEGEANYAAFVGDIARAVLAAGYTRGPTGASVGAGRVAP